MIKLEALRVFVTVAEAGNIRDAADQLGRTPSAISMALKHIEEELGGRLFESDRKSGLTALGAFMLDAGRSQIRSYDNTVSMIRAFAHNRIGRLTLASVPSVAANLIPPILPGFVADRPGVEIELLDTDGRGVAAMVESGQADFGIAGQPTSDTQMKFEPVFRDRFKVVCSASSRLGRSAHPLRWIDLEDEPLILNGASNMIQAPKYRSLAAKASLTVRNITSLVALTKAGFGVTLLPALSTVNLPRGVVALDLADTRVDRAVGILERRESYASPVASAFRSYMLGQMPRLISQLGLASP